MATMVLEMEAYQEEVEAHQDRMSGKADLFMEHREAIEMMASEKYLLNELSPELREGFEEHYFGCLECAQDVRMGATFLEHAKRILPEMESSAVTPLPSKRDWSWWLKSLLGPVVIGPVFACLVAIVGYQNLVVLPALEASASAPQVLPVATVLHDETRGGLPIVFADLRMGSTISVEVPASANYDTYKFEFLNSKGEVIRTVLVPGTKRTDDMMSVWLPGGVKQDTYKLVISGVTPSGGAVAVKQQMFTLQSGK